jgi:hypothetical protein
MKSINTAYPADASQPSCKRCDSGSFYTEPAKPPHYLALRCRDCSLFQRFLPKGSPALKPVKEVQLDVTPDTDRIGQIEREIAKINRILLVHTAILGRGAGARPAGGSFQREITDEQILNFSQAVGGVE